MKNIHDRSFELLNNASRREHLMTQRRFSYWRSILFVLVSNIVFALSGQLVMAAPPDAAGWASEECIGINVTCEPGSSPPGPPSSANLILESDFETGEYSTYGWGPSGNAPQVVSAPEPVCRGKYSVKFPLDYHKDPVRKRTELAGGVGNLTYGEEYWVGFAMYVPAGMLETPRGGLQLHRNKDPEDVGAFQPMVFWLKDGQWRVRIAWDSNKVQNGNTSGIFDKDLGEPKLGQWTEVVMHFKVTYKRDGFLQVWLDGVPVVDVSNIGIGANNDRGPFPKIGIYHYEWDNNPPDADGKNLIYFDEVRFGNKNATFDDVVPRCGNS